MPGLEYRPGVRAVGVNRRRASNKRRTSNTGRVSNRSPVFVYSVLYSRCIFGIGVLSTVQPVYCRYWCTQYCTACVLLVSQYCTAGILLVFVYCTAGVRAIGVNRRRASNKRRASNTGRGSEPFVPIDAGGFYSRKYGISNVKVKGLSTTKIEHIFDASVN